MDDVWICFFWQESSISVDSFHWMNTKRRGINMQRGMKGMAPWFFQLAPFSSPRFNAVFFSQRTKHKDQKERRSEWTNRGNKWIILRKWFGRIDALITDDSIRHTNEAKKNCDQDDHLINDRRINIVLEDWNGAANEREGGEDFIHLPSISKFNHVRWKHPLNLQRRSYFSPQFFDSKWTFLRVLCTG